MAWPDHPAVDPSSRRTSSLALWVDDQAPHAPREPRDLSLGVLRCRHEAGPLRRLRRHRHGRLRLGSARDLAGGLGLSCTAGAPREPREAHSGFRRRPYPDRADRARGRRARRHARGPHPRDRPPAELGLFADRAATRRPPPGCSTPRETDPPHRHPTPHTRATAPPPLRIEIPLAPFFGVMGVAPRPDYGRVTTIIPREFGGNLDLKELVAGTTLYLPIWSPGALFSVGDGHGVRGDGDAASTALETPLSGTFELILRNELKLDMPRAETPTHWISLGLDEDLDDAAKQALRQMIKLLGELAGLSPEDAYILS